MSWNSGAGAPGVFRCSQCRRFDSGAKWPQGAVSDVELTGRTKPYTGKGHARTSRTSREYRCSCGHIGWSNHRQLARFAGDASD